MAVGVSVTQIKHIQASWILVKGMKMCIVFDQKGKTLCSSFQYWQTSHFWIDNNSANHNQEPNSLFRQSTPHAVPGYLRL